VCIVLCCRPSWLPAPGMPSPHKLLVHHLPAPLCSRGSCQLPSPKVLLLPVSPIPHPVPLCFSSSGSFICSCPSSLLSFHSHSSQYQDAFSTSPLLHEGCLGFPRVFSVFCLLSFCTSLGIRQESSNASAENGDVEVKKFPNMIKSMSTLQSA